MSFTRALAAALLAVACRDEPTATVLSPPTIDAASIAANSNNVLSAIVSVRATPAMSAIVRFHSATGELDSGETPPVTTVDDDTVIPVFGLHPDRHYVMQVVVHGPGGDATSDELTLTTGPLPSLIPQYAAGGTNPTPGYVAFAVGGYGIVIDNSGRVVWYHRFGDAPFLNFQPQRTGRYVAGASAANPGGPFTEIDPFGNTTRTLGCARGLKPRFHDVLFEADGSYWLMCDESRLMDLSAIGGVPGATVSGTVVQRLTAAGQRVFEWSSFDHFSITDLEPSARTGPNVNWTHGNAIDIDADGNLLISFRSLSELTKVDTRTGAVLWRMGGSRSDFAFEGTDRPAFARQHGLRSAGSNSLMILDNLGAAEMSRAERYEFNEVARTVRLGTSYAPGRPVVTLLGGSTQQLPDGHLLVAYGSGGRVEEFDAEGRVVWEIHGDAGYVFRATRMASLYDPVPY